MRTNKTQPHVTAELTAISRVLRYLAVNSVLHVENTLFKLFGLKENDKKFCRENNPNLLLF